MKDIFNMFCIALLAATCFMTGLYTAPSGKICTRTDVKIIEEKVKYPEFPEAANKYKLQAILLGNFAPASMLQPPHDVNKYVKGR